jgi:hypothetical protein
MTEISALGTCAGELPRASPRGTNSSTPQIGLRATGLLR